MAELDGQIVGYGIFNHKFFNRCRVEMLMVDSRFRGQKIGQRLLNALEKLCDTAKLFVTTNQSNHNMQQLLVRCGFRKCGFIEELDADDPELVFVKVLENAG